VEVDLQVRAVRRGDVFLLCSDGLSGPVNGRTRCGTLVGKFEPAGAPRGT
jgi:serine/threonine protein phosphatase PrpC